VTAATAGALDAPLFGSETPRVCTNEIKRKCLERELGYRRQVYPRLVERQKMRQEHADRECWIIERILAEGFTP
jgi:hypothetical protein